MLTSVLQHRRMIGYSSMLLVLQSCQRKERVLKVGACSVKVLWELGSLMAGRYHAANRALPRCLTYSGAFFLFRPRYACPSDDGGSSWLSRISNTL